MTEKQLSSAIIQFAEYTKECSKYVTELNRATATVLLKIPIGVNYEFWCCLHKMKGDWIE